MPAARHVALAEQLANEISEGSYGAGTRFPTEQDLKQRFGVGRYTIREALKTLREQGLVSRRQKVGTTVLTERPSAHYSHRLKDLNGLVSLARDTVLDTKYDGYVTMSGERAFGFDDGPDRWLRIAGLRSQRGNQKPLSWCEIFVPEQFVRDREALREHDCSVFERVMQQNGLRMEYVEQEIKAAVIPALLAGQLDVEAGSPALLVARRYVSHTGVTFEVAQNLYPSDRYSVRSLIRHRG
jgi:DNA-binding GntR family transcriptional regulator